MDTDTAGHTLDVDARHLDPGGLKLTYKDWRLVSELGDDILRRIGYEQPRQPGYEQPRQPWMVVDIRFVSDSTWITLGSGIRGPVSNVWVTIEFWRMPESFLVDLMVRLRRRLDVSDIVLDGTGVGLPVAQHLAELEVPFTSWRP